MVQDPNEYERMLIKATAFVFAAYFFIQCLALARFCLK
jgi:hypothetical protein